jgi:uridine kinase
MDEKACFFEIKYWVCREYFKSNKAKGECEFVNRPLIISGDSGVGKITFVSKLVHPVFFTHNVGITEFDYQSKITKEDEVRVFVSPDYSDLDEMYDFSLMLQAEKAL